MGSAEGFLLTLVSLGVTATCALALQLQMGFGEQKCLKESIPPEVSVKVYFEPSAGVGEMELNLVVRDATGQVYYHKRGLAVHKFEFRSHARDGRSETGERDYTFCLYHAPMRGDTRKGSKWRRKVSFSIEYAKGSKELKDLAKTEHLDKVDARISDLREKINSVLQVMETLRRNEKQISERNADTNARVVWYSLFACCLMLVVGIYQVLQFKRFFRRRKLV